MKFINNLVKFMYGRYGIDNLHKFCLWFYIFIVIVNIFLHSNILIYTEIIIFIIVIYRMFSKNIYRRNLENQMYLKLKKILLKPFNNIKRNFLDRKKYVYKKCHKCKTTLRLPIPYKRGFNHVICPECKNRITCFSLRQKKIEIIRNKKGK